MHWRHKMTLSFAVSSLVVAAVPTPYTFDTTVSIRNKHCIETDNFYSLEKKQNCDEFNFDHKHMKALLSSETITMPESIKTASEFDSWFDSIIPSL